MLDKRVDDINKRYKALKDKRKDWLEICKEVTKYILPTRGHYDDSNSEDVLQTEFNDKAVEYAENLASMFMSGITSPSRPWLRLIIEDQEMMDWSPAKTWLSEVERIVANAFRSGNFYSEIYNAYQDIVCHGVVCTSVYRDTRAGRVGRPVFSTYQPGEYYADVDEYGVVSIVYREIWMSAYMVYRRWPETCSQRTKELFKDNPYKRIKIIHVAEPRKERDRTKIDRANKPIASYWWEHGEDKLLAEGGFDLMPYQIARWNANNGAVYSVGLGWRALKEAKAMNILEYLAAYGVNKALNPPVLVPENNMYGSVNNAPGGINYYSGNVHEKQVYPLQTITADLQAAMVYMDRWDAVLKAIFKNDLFIFMMNNPGVTATEIASRNDEKLLLLAPVLERINTEMLTPMVDTTISMLMREGFLPPPPPDLVGMEIKPQFVGVLAQAQLQHNTQAIDKIIGISQSIANAGYPQIYDKIDFEQGVDIESIILGAPPGVIRPDDQVQQIREQRAEAERQAMEAQQQAQMVEEMKTASDAARSLAQAGTAGAAV